jgi:hypothetical protein
MTRFYRNPYHRSGNLHVKIVAQERTKGAELLDE